jgi:fucose permease
MVASGLLAGLGAGAIDAGLNTYAATHFSARSVNWLHACYGIGATIGPIIMTSVLASGHRWQWGYAIVGIGQLALALCFALTCNLWTNDGSLQRTSTSTSTQKISSRDTLRLPIVWLSIGVFFIYTGLEAAAGTWSYSLFTEGRAIPMTTAGTSLSVYWGCLTAGRLLSGFIVNFVSVRQLMRLCMIGLAIAASLIWINLTSMLSFFGLALMGLSSAPIFPSMIATTPERLGEVHTANAVGFQIAAAVLGQSLLPSLVGVLVANFGLESIAPALLCAAILLLVIYEWLLWMRPRGVRVVKNEIKLAL